jgi:hypothetical protein
LGVCDGDNSEKGGKDGKDGKDGKAVILSEAKDRSDHK